MCVICEVVDIENMTDAEKVKVLRYALENVRESLSYTNRVQIIDHVLEMTKPYHERITTFSTREDHSVG